MQKIPKLQKLWKAWIAQEGDGRPGEAVEYVEDSEAAEAGEGADDSGWLWSATGGRGLAWSPLSLWRLWRLWRTAECRGALRSAAEYLGSLNCLFDQFSSVCLKSAIGLEVR